MASGSYPVVDIRGSVNDLGPEEALAECVAHRLALPIYWLTSGVVVVVMGLYTLFFQDRVRSRLQLPNECKFRTCFLS
jgi:hypothetical protein